MTRKKLSAPIETIEIRSERQAADMEENTTLTGKKRNWKCSFNKDWETIYPWVKPVPSDSSKVSCEICSSQFSISHGGEYDTNSARHIKNVLLKKSLASLWIRSC